MYSVGTDDVDDASSLRDRPDWSRVEHPPGPLSSSEEDDTPLIRVPSTSCGSVLRGSGTTTSGLAPSTTTGTGASTSAGLVHSTSDGLPPTSSSGSEVSVSAGPSASSGPVPSTSSGLAPSASSGLVPSTSSGLASSPSSGAGAPVSVGYIIPSEAAGPSRRLNLDTSSDMGQDHSVMSVSASTQDGLGTPNYPVRNLRTSLDYSAQDH